MKKEELQDLIGSWLDGRLDEAGSSKLQEQLRLSPEARQEFRRWTKLDVALREQSQREVETPASDQMLANASPRGGFRLLGWVMAAVCLMAAIGVASLWRKEVRGRMALTSGATVEQTNIGCAILTRATEAVFANGLNVRVGDTINTGHLQLLHGAAQIEFFSGASMLLEEGASLELVSSWEAVCREGRMTVRVPPPAHGFKLRTPGMDLVDLGTEFGVNTDAHGASEVHVFEGKVEAHPRTGAMQLLTTGQSLRQSPDQSLSPGRAQPSNFPSIERLNDISSNHLRARYDAWSARMQEVRADPRLVACYLFKHRSADKWDRLVDNLAEPENSSRSGGAVGVRWTEGRWPMKDALEFKSPGDRVRINLGDEAYSSITLACWVRVDGVDRKYNALLLTDGYDEGEPHWQIYEDGSLMFSIAYRPPNAADSAKKNNQIYYSPRIFDLGNQRRWHHIAVTYENQSGAVVQYLDGREISREVSSFHRPGRPIHFGPSEIGNWGLPTANHQFPIRNLNGRMDEFLIFKTALTGTEIQSLYEAGKPD